MMNSGHLKFIKVKELDDDYDYEKIIIKIQQTPAQDINQKNNLISKLKERQHEFEQALKEKEVTQKKKFQQQIKKEAANERKYSKKLHRAQKSISFK